MNVYQYQVYAPDRTVKAGEISAVSETTAEQAIRRMGYQRILSLKEKENRVVEKVLGELTRQKITEKDIMEFAYELAQLLESGIALMKSLDFITEVTKNKSLKTVINAIIDSINNGNSFSYAISQQGVFSDTFIQVISASEKSGNLEKGLVYLADFLNKRIETKKKLRRVFAYPAVILTMAFAVGLFLVLYIIPSLSDVFRSTGAKLPVLTAGMMAISDFFVNNILVILVTVAVIVLLGFLYLRTENGKRRLDDLLLRIPVLNGMVRTSNMLTYSHMSAMLLKSGLKLPQVLFFAANTVSNRHLRETLMDARVQLLQGQSLTAVMRQKDVFSRMEVEKLAIGERTGDISFAFENIAVAQEKLLAERQAAFVATIEPAITIAIGIAIAIIALSTILPMYSLAGSIN